MATNKRVREYESELRREQARLTREAILSAFADQLSGGAADISVPTAAAHAGVSVRTVYHYFPDREARLEALAHWVEEQLQPEPFVPCTADDLVELTRRVYEGGARNEALTRAQIAAGVAQEVRTLRRRERVEAIRAVVTAVGAPEVETRLAVAVIAHLISAEAAFPMMDLYGLTFHEASKAAQMAVAATVAELRQMAGSADNAAGL